LQARIVAAHGRLFIAENVSGNVFRCIARGRKNEAVCGDEVEISVTGPDDAVMDRILPRRTLFRRADRFRTKTIAANASLLLVVVAPVPSFSMELVQRFILAAENQGMRAMIVLNKNDLPQHQAALERIKPLAAIGYPVLSLCAMNGAAEIKQAIEGEQALMVGQSGMGKSTIINALVPDAVARTAEISVFLDSGRHTTSYTRQYRLDERTTLVDSPGVQEFGLAYMDQAALESGFPEFRPFLGKCRFRNCRHVNEPGCAIAVAVNTGEIAQARLDLYRNLMSETDAARL
jgi:ribosome biogenesis GTPase